MEVYGIVKCKIKVAQTLEIGWMMKPENAASWCFKVEPDYSNVLKNGSTGENGSLRAGMRGQGTARSHDFCFICCCPCTEFSAPKQDAWLLH